MFSHERYRKGSMVFHYIKEAGQAIYHDQHVYQVVYKNFVQGMRNAFRLLMEKHPILRTAYIQKSLLHAVQECPGGYPVLYLSRMGRGDKEALLRGAWKKAVPAPSISRRPHCGG
jgi:hypothetical protein